MGVILVYLEMVCNLFGFIGGIDMYCFNEFYLCDVVCNVDLSCVEVKCLFCFVII